MATRRWPLDSELSATRMPTRVATLTVTVLDVEAARLASPGNRHWKYVCFDGTRVRWSLPEASVVSELIRVQVPPAPGWHNVAHLRT